MSLKKYQQKRRFDVTPEPSGNEAAAKKKPVELIFVVQKHRASHLHYDFRLEMERRAAFVGGAKGPSLDPSVKRLAMQVEDHPIEYATFEGVIPEGEYGGGTVMVWDQGTWEPEQPDPDAALAKGDLKFTLYGKKLKGSWVLVRTRGFGGSSGTLLVAADQASRPVCFATGHRRRGASLGGHRKLAGRNRSRWRRKR